MNRRPWTSISSQPSPLTKTGNLSVLVVAHVGEVEQQVVAHLLLHYGSVDRLTWT